ncbi:glycosyltransferase family 2 protein [Candidatus Saccharibacteria bacterium]|nr:glycosyltransferase family 2 protein [Candidatus Saccharibacteria bacterium]
MRSIEIPQPGERDWRYRTLEILPGLLTWIILSLPVVLSIVNPILAAYFILAYLLLWFARAMGLNVRSLQGWRNMNQHQRTSWDELNKDLEVLEPHTKNAPKWHARNLERVRQYIPEQRRIKPSEVYHAVIIAFWNESRDVLEPTVRSVVEADYDPKKIILILAYEQRGGPEVEALAKGLIKNYGHHFYHTEAVMHPWPMIGEVVGKGGNVTFTARRLKKYLEEEKIDPTRVLVTTLDADNRPHKKYFGALTYTYCSTEEPKNASYQPIAMFTNNIWDAPALMRVVAAGNSFWNVVLSLRPHLLRNFSAHAQPMSALIDTDFWSVRTIVEDGHQYWRTFFRYDGKHDVFPIYVPIYQDAVLTENYRRTLKMQFKQVQRWSYGSSDIAYVFYNGFLKKNRVPRLKMIARFGRLLEGHISWSTAPLILLLAALVPFLINPQSYLTNQLPQVARWVQTVATAGILISLYLSFRSLPPKPERYKRRRTFLMVIQWVLLPVTTIVYGAFAAINSQTRLMFGWYLGWTLTEKAVKKDAATARRGVLRRSAGKLGGLISLVRRQPHG